MRRIKVQYTKLGKQKAWGLAHSDELIEVDIRLKGRKAMEILIHEICHILAPGDSEEEVVRKSIILTKTLWHEGYRKIDNTEDIPMQDGSL
jgi:hypothetical protein